MTRFELVCLTIVAVYVALRLRLRSGATDGTARAFVERFVLLSISSAVAEDTLIRAHGYYGYATTWSLFVDRVPLVVILVWPVVVDSAAVLARAISSSRSHPATPLRVAALTAAIVLADAALIEPVAVRAGLWRWTEPGVFGVPILGILGWAVFAFVATWILETRLRRAVLLVGPIATHAAVVALWFAGLRFAEVPIPPFAAALVAWGGSVACVTRAASRPVSMRALLMRAPGAVFFFVLLAQTVAAPSAFREPWSASWAAPPVSAALLVVYVTAFAAPYLAAVARAAVTLRRPRIPSSSPPPAS